MRSLLRVSAQTWQRLLALPELRKLGEAAAGMLVFAAQELWENPQRQS